MVYGMDWRAWHGIGYGLASMTWYMIGPCGPGMEFAMAWWAWQGICVFAGEMDRWYTRMVWPGE